MSRKIPIESDDDNAKMQESASGVDRKTGDAGKISDAFYEAMAAAETDERQQQSQTSQTVDTHAAEGGGSRMNNEDTGKSAGKKMADESRNAESPVDIDKLKLELEEKDAALQEAIKQKDEYVEHLQRMKAEFENYKKRTTREKSDTVCFANEKLIGKLLPVADNLQRGCECAVEHAKDEQGKSILKGIELVEKQLIELLSEFGANAFDSIGEKFDPNIHEPLYTIPRDDVEDNTVVEEIEKGYMLNERLLRPAKVAVSRAAE